MGQPFFVGENLDFKKTSKVGLGFACPLIQTDAADQLKSCRPGGPRYIKKKKIHNP